MPAISVAMIVRNEASNLEACLVPIRDLVDEIVIADTGSTDDTIVHAEKLGARVVHFPWADSFAAARNAAIEHATGDWIFILDADDRILKSQRILLTQLFEKLRDENVGYLLGHVSLGPDGDYGSEADQVRLFRRRLDVRYAYRVHEQVGPSILASGGHLEHSGIRILHLGFHDPNVLARKQERNLRLAELDAVDRSADPIPLFNYGMLLSASGRHQQAITALAAARSLVEASSPIRPALLLHLASSYRSLGDRSTALSVVRAFEATDIPLSCLEAQILIEGGDIAAAAARLQALATPKVLLSIADICARVLYGEVLLSLGRFHDAEIEARSLLTQRPTVEPAWRVLADALLGQDRRDDMLVVADGVEPHHSRLAASIRDAAQTNARPPLLACRTSPWTLRGAA